ncbi:MAG: ACP phosphodiesterase [Verrucomicrobiota bacterium]
MNLLAHLQLSVGCDADSLTANVLADYLMRYDPPDAMPAKLRNRLEWGMELHREIDHFTDSHPLVQQACALISSKRSRLASIIMDVGFDWFLTRHWEQLTDQSRENTISRGYATMRMVAATGLSQRTQALIGKMRQKDWLTAYGTWEGQAKTFERMSRRNPNLSRLVGAETELMWNEKQIEPLFLEFYPALQNHVKVVSESIEL